MGNYAKRLCLSMFGHKRFSREGGVEVVVEELSTRMVRLGCIRKVSSYVQNGENDSGSSEEKKSLKRISSLIIACRDTPEIFQATKTALYYIPALVNLPVIFPGVKQILDRRDGVLGAMLSKIKSNFLCPIRPISQNVAALDFSKLLQKRDGLITISTVTSR